MIPPCILVTVEGLGTNLLGCYGGALTKTPNVDQFAASAVVFDQCWLQSLQVEDSLRAILMGQTYRLDGRTAGTDDQNEAEGESAAATRQLLRFIQDQAISTCFVTDAIELHDSSFLDHFDDVALIDFENDERTSERADQTRMARLMQVAITRLYESVDLDDNGSGVGLLWIHSKGLNTYWDAPYELRSIPCDEDDPLPSTDPHPPRRLLDADSNPDVLFDAICGASAQAAIFDFSWSYINELVEELMTSHREQHQKIVEPVVMLMGLNGYPLGEHEAIGDIDQQLYAERLHVPLVIRPRTLLLGLRLPHLIQPWQVGQLLVEALSTPADVDEQATAFWKEPPQLSIDWKPEHRLAWAVNDHEYALITPAWTSRVAVAPSIKDNPNRADLSMDAITPMALWQVFVNPDDRFQQNDIADRVEPVVKRLSEIATRLRDAIYGTEGQIDVRDLQVSLESLITDDLIRLVA